MPGVILLKKYGARIPSLEEIRMHTHTKNDYKMAQMIKICYPKCTTSLEHLCIGSVKRLPNFEDKIKILPVTLQKNILTFDDILDE